MVIDYPYWYNAYIATTVVSILPNVLLFLIPSTLLLQKTVNGLNWKHILLCFAAAGLLGDVFIHTIPHLLGGHDHDHGLTSHGFEHLHAHNHLDLHNHDHHDEHHHEDEHDHHHDHHHGHHHDHHHEEEHDHRVLHEEHSHDVFGFLGSLGLEKQLVVQLVVVWGFLVFLMAEKIAKQFCGGHSHDHSSGHKDHDDDDDKKTKKLPKSKTAASSSIFSKLQSSGWLNLFADSMHNFTDGIAIGASFANAGTGLGFATFVSVVCHEIPHEIGDFTILVNNGLSKYEAIKAQFLTAIAALLGTAVGLLAQRNEVLEQLMLAFSAGGFLYISTVNILPEIVNEKSSSKQVICEFIAFALGIAMMVLVALFE